MGRQGRPLWIRLGWESVGEEAAAQSPHPPQGFSDHVFICDPIVSEGLIPCGVQSVSESFCSELICLQRATNNPVSGRQTNGPQRCPHPQPPQPVTMFSHVAKGNYDCNQLTLKQGDYLEDLGGPCVIAGSLKVVEIGRRGESEGDVMREDGQERQCCWL